MSRADTEARVRLRPVILESPGRSQRDGLQIVIDDVPFGPGAASDSEFDDIRKWLMNGGLEDLEAAGFCPSRMQRTRKKVLTGG